MFLCSPVDWLEVGGFSFVTTGIRASWALLVALAAWPLPRRDEAYAHRAAMVAGVGTILHFAALTWVCGGSSAMMFQWLVALPLGMSLILQPLPRTAVWNGIAGVAAVLTIVILDGESPARIAQWFFMSLAAAAVSVLGVHSFRRMSRMQLASAEQRAEALQRLAHTEKVAARSERLAIVGQLAAGVAHEINNPLSFVRSNVACLESAAERPGEYTAEEVTEMFAETRSGLERIRQIVSDLRSFAREDDDGVLACEINPVVEDALRLARVKLKGVAELEVRLPPQLPPATANPRHLAQVLLNLVVNAADALESGTVSKPRVTLTAWVEEGFVVIAVQDNGPGIPPPVRARLFEPFFTTKAPGKGTGLGLSLSREYMTRMGGSLQLADHPGPGARFELRMPLSRPSAEVVAIDPATLPGASAALLEGSAASSTGRA